MRSLMDDVAEFHRAADVPINTKLTKISKDRGLMRVGWTRSELEEMEEAIRVDDMVSIADAIADTIYFAVGTALEYGIPLDKVWDIVQERNMAKRNADGVFDKTPEGRILKPMGWYPADIDIAKLLKDYE